MPNLHAPTLAAIQKYINSLGITFRPIESNDMDFLFELYASTRQEELALVNWNDEQKFQFLNMQFTAQHKHYQQHYPEAEFLIILQHQQPIGRLYINHYPAEYRIIDITLHPSCRNQGIGNVLMQSIIQKATRHHKPVRIHVEKHNPAQRLYQRLGFQKIEDKGVYDFLERACGPLQSTTEPNP